jgi:predicted MFS family arabinose efflux permease
MNRMDRSTRSNSVIIEKLKGYLSMDNKTLLYFFVIVGTTQTIYSVVALREVLYEPFRGILGTSNAAFGTLLGLVGIVQIFGYLAFGWLQDKINIRTVLTIDLLGYGISALIMASIPNLPYSVLIVIFCLFGFFGDAIYWPTIQKSIKGLSHPNKQATVFGFMEAWRGVTGIILNSLAVLIYTILGNALFGMRVAMSFNSILMILFAFIVWKYIPNNFLRDISQKGKKKTSLKHDKEHVLLSLKNPVVWLTGLSASCIYAVFAGVTTYFVPFLQNVYALPVAMVGIFGIVNGQVTRMISSALSGVISDGKFKNSSSWMSICYGLIAFVFAVILVIPRKTGFLAIMIPLMLLVSIFCYFIRGIYYAPIGEAKIPNEYSATAMSIASFIGYSPNFWAFTLFGYLLDKYPKSVSYKYIFIILLALSILGIIINAINSRYISREQQKRG